MIMILKTLVNTYKETTAIHAYTEAKQTHC